MKNEPLDYFNPKPKRSYAFKSYHKLIINVRLLIGCGLTILWIFLDDAHLLSMSLLITFLLAIFLFSFWGLINIFQSYNNGEDKTTKRIVVFIFHILFLSLSLFFILLIIIGGGGREKGPMLYLLF